MKFDYDKFRVITKEIEEFLSELHKRYGFGEYQFLQTFELKRSVFKCMMPEPEFKHGDIVETATQLYYGFPKGVDGMVVGCKVADGNSRSGISYKYLYKILVLDTVYNRNTIPDKINHIESVSDDEIILTDGKSQEDD